MIKNQEKGFVLATSLVILLLMTILTAAVFISVDSSQKSSMAAESSTQAFYYAETAANYMAWALKNNAEFDSYSYNPSPVKTSGEFTFNEPDARVGVLPIPLKSGDYDEWKANPGNPSGDDRVVKPDGTYVKNAAGLDAFGQLMYYDNAPLDNRMVSLRSQDLYTKARNTNTGTKDPLPLYGIYRYLPRYIMLKIDSDGKIAPSMPPVNAASPWHGTNTGDLKADIENDKGVHYPTKGALVWVTGGNRTDDYQLDPIDNFFAPVFSVDVANVRTDDPNGVYAGTITCVPSAALQTSIACSSTGTWLTDADYGLVIYALGYVRGKAQKLIRVVYKE